MAKGLLVVQRRPVPVDRLACQIDTLARSLTPDNMPQQQPAFASVDGATAAIFSPNGATRLSGTSIAIGQLIGDTTDWDKPGTPPPDGSFALLRADAERAELIADAAGSRTIWYVLTADQLIASTSQRAIVALLGNFELNRRVLPWMLSSGTLGPTGGWDSRLEQVRPGERVTLDRSRWRLSHSLTRREFTPDTTLSEDQHLDRLASALETTCEQWQFDPRKWVLPLSGGADSRGLLFLLKERQGLSTVTWGTRAARTEQGNDAWVARRLAEEVGVENRYFESDGATETTDRVVQRFLEAGEGRVARISGYVDGFRVWRTLFDEGIDGVIRGDEAFGSIVVRNAYGVRYTASLTTLTDYWPAAEVASYELPDQTIPEELGRREGETLATWRDRLYLDFRIPALLAGLTDLKAAYVEVANPLLTHAVLKCVCALPDDLRTDKRLWRELVRSQRPNIPFASRSAVVALNDFCNDRNVLQLMLAEMESASAAELFAPALRHKICTTIRTTLQASPRKRLELRQQLLRSMPDRLRLAARSWIAIKPTLDPIVVAFRSFLASRMNTMLKLDAAPPADVRSAVNL